MTTFRPLYLLLAFVVFSLVVITVHQRAFSGPLYYDSSGWMEEREHVFVAQGLLGVINLFRQRPVPMATFYVNYLLGGMNPYGFRLFNAMLMGAAGVMLAVVIVLLLDALPSLQRVGPAEKTATGFLLGLIFVVHPVQAYVVVYVWQRMALLSALFYLCGLAAYLSVRTGRLQSAAAGYGACLVLFLLAMLSKECAITFPVALLLLELALFTEPWFDRAKRFALIFGVTAVIVAGMSYLERAHASELYPAGIMAAVDRYHRESGLTLLQVTMENCRLLFSYLGLIFFPAPSKLQLVSPIAPWSIAGATMPNMVYTVAAGLFVASGGYLLRRRPLSGFGILFFVLGLLPESFMVPQYLFVVYRVAFPMAGILMVAADIAAALLEKAHAYRLQRPARIAMCTGVAVCAALLGYIDFAKAELWRDPVLFWGEAVRQLPPLDQKPEKHGTAQVLNGLGFALQRAGRSSEAVAWHQQAAKVDPGEPLAYVALGTAYSNAGNKAEAEASMRRALELAPKDPLAHEALANFLSDNKPDEGAEALFRKAMELDPDHPRVLDNFARFLIDRQRYSDALPLVESSLRLNSRSARAQYFMGKILMRTGNTDGAVTHLLKAVEFKPDFWEAHNDIGVILGRSGHPFQAVVHFRKALEINPNDAPTKANLAAALQQIERVAPPTHPGR